MLVLQRSNRGRGISVRGDDADTGVGAIEARQQGRLGVTGTRPDSPRESEPHRAARRCADSCACR